MALPAGVLKVTVEFAKDLKKTSIIGKQVRACVQVPQGLWGVGLGQSRREGAPRRGGCRLGFELKAWA